MATPLLGWISPQDRTQDQHDAHAKAESVMHRQFAFVAKDVPKGTKLILTDTWKHPDVVTDVGRRFIRELQNTGACVKVGGTNALRVTIAGQRVAADNPVKAFEPFGWHNYAMSRHYMGEDGQGEGSLGSTFAKSLREDGAVEWPVDATDKLPDYTISGDHISISASQEMAWSSYRNPNLAAVVTVAKQRLLGSAAVLNTPADILAMNQNAYGVTFACDNYIGNASIHGSGANSYVRGRWNGRGGHQQWVFGFWNHPDDGPLYAVGNNWSDETYPADPAGLPLCCCWVAEADVAAAFRLNAEVYGLSHQDWFPAMPKIADFYLAP